MVGISSRAVPSLLFEKGSPGDEFFSFRSSENVFLPLPPEGCVARFRIHSLAILPAVESCSLRLHGSGGGTVTHWRSRADVPPLGSKNASFSLSFRVSVTTPWVWSYLVQGAGVGPALWRLWGHLLPRLEAASPRALWAPRLPPVLWDDHGLKVGLSVSHRSVFRLFLAPVWAWAGWGPPFCPRGLGSRSLTAGVLFLYF